MAARSLMLDDDRVVMRRSFIGALVDRVYSSYFIRNAVLKTSHGFHDMKSESRIARVGRCTTRRFVKILRQLSHALSGDEGVDV